MDSNHGWKLIVIPVGGLVLLGILIWLSIHFWTAYSRLGGSGNLIGGVVCALLIVAGLAVAVKMTM